MARGLVGQGEFVEVFVSTPLAVAEARDPKGLYKKARAGEIKHFTGVDDPYEPPLKPEVAVHSDRESVDESVARIVGTLEVLGYIPRVSGGDFSAAEEETVKRRLKDLGYI